MKSLIPLFAGVAVLFALSLSDAQTPVANLLPNPGFENGLNWWGFTDSLGVAGAATIHLDDPAAVHSGTKGVKIIVTEVAEENWHIQMNIPPQWDAEMDKNYVLTFWGKAAIPDKVFHLAVQNGAPTYDYLYGEDFQLDTSWQQYKFEWLSAAEGKEALRFNIFLGTDTSTYYFDDFSLAAHEKVGTQPVKLIPAARPVDANSKLWDILGRSMIARSFMKGIKIKSVPKIRK